MGNFSTEIENPVRVLIILSFISSTALFPLMIFFVFKKSKQMKKYKFYLLNTTIWCYVYHLIVFINHANILFPSPCIMFHSILNLSQTSTVVMFYLAFFAIVNLDLSIVWSLFYRFSQAYPTRLDRLFEKSKSIYLVYAIVHCFVYVSVLSPMMIGQRWDWNETRIQFLKDNPDLLAYINSPMICFQNEENFRRFELYLAIMFLVFFFIGNILHGLLIHLSQNAKRNSLVSSTYRLHIMLLKAFSVQLIIGYALLLLPVVIQGFLIYNEVANTGKTSTVILALISFHGTIDDLTMIYFIKPWRETVLSWIKRSSKSSIFSNPNQQCALDLVNRTSPIYITRTSNS
ncbi:hypothetical protein M3Y96_00580300 [Aphelenchoides besseyi]|nr:hypothetical protein M3Y96_00580300 [Aphelenchoides besseyi]